MNNQRKATLIGLVAIVLWSSVVGLIRGVSESLGVVGGAAMMYSVASALLLFTVGFPKIRTFPRRYLFWGSLLFVSYELCLALSIGYANSSRQAIEVGMVNYLWPAFTILSAILFNRQQASLLIIPGFVIAILGICWVLGGEQGLDFSGMAANILDNPLSYGLAFAGALIWAAYCTVTTRLAGGKNGITLFFMLTALALWAKYLAIGGQPMQFSYHALIYLVLAASAMGFGYAAWNVGILHGKCHSPRRGFVFHSGILCCAGGHAVEHTAFAAVLARRIHGLHRVDSLLVCDPYEIANAGQPVLGICLSDPPCERRGSYPMPGDPMNEMRFRMFGRWRDTRLATLE